MEAEISGLKAFCVQLADHLANAAEVLGHLAEKRKPPHGRETRCVPLVRLRKPTLCRGGKP